MKPSASAAEYLSFNWWLTVQANHLSLQDPSSLQTLGRDMVLSAKFQFQRVQGHLQTNKGLDHQEIKSKASPLLFTAGCWLGVCDDLLTLLGATKGSTKGEGLLEMNLLPVVTEQYHELGCW